MGRYLGATIGFGIAMNSYGDYPEGVYEVFSDQLDEEDFDWYELFETLKKEHGIDVTQEHFGYDYEAWAMMARESVTEFYEACTPFTPGLVDESKNEKYQAELDKALEKMGLGDLGLKGTWLLLTSIG